MMRDLFALAVLVVRRFDENHQLIPASRFMLACGGHDQTVSKTVEN